MKIGFILILCMLIVYVIVSAIKQQSKCNKICYPYQSVEYWSGYTVCSTVKKIVKF